MRILLAHNRYRHSGGEERHIDLLETALTDLGHAVRRYEPSSSNLVRHREKASAAAAITYSPRAGRALAKFLVATPTDVVHFHNLTPSLTPAALRAAKVMGSRVVLTAHNYRLVCAAGTMTRQGRPHDECIRSSLVCGLKGGRESRLESILYGISIELQRRLQLVERWTDAIVTPSRAVADVLVRSGYAHRKIYVIPYGVPAMEPAEGDTTSAEYALFAGRLSPEKGVATLLNAARAAAIPLTIVGGGPLATVVRAASKNGVRYLGHVDAEKVRVLRQRAAFVVAPSEWPDVLPFSVLEALADGVPVIATPLGGLAEIARFGGIRLVAPHAPAELAHAMRELWCDVELRRRLAEQAAASARQNYSLRRQTEALVGVYEATA